MTARSRDWNKQFLGDQGAGGSVGYVTAPAAGDAAAGKFLKADGTWAIPSGGGGGTPGGSNQQIQFNDGGVFGGSSGFRFDRALIAASLGPGSSVPGTTTGTVDSQIFNALSLLPPQTALPNTLLTTAYFPDVPTGVVSNLAVGTLADYVGGIDAVNIWGTYSEATTTTKPTSLGALIGLIGEADWYGSGNALFIAGIDGEAFNNGTGGVDSSSQLAGGSFTADNLGSGIVANAFAIITYDTGGTGPATNFTSIQVQSQSNPTIVNKTGLEIQDVAGATTNSAIKTGLGKVQFGDFFTTHANAAPADALLSAGEIAFWFDKTNGASKLMLKAKQADGTVKTAQVALA